MSDSKPNLQLAPASIAPLHKGSVYQTGQNNTDNAVKQQMALIGGKLHQPLSTKSRRKIRKSKSRRKHRKSKKDRKKKTRRRRIKGGGDAIKPQTFPPTYPVPAGSVTPDQNSAAITQLFADSAANAEFDSKVGGTGAKSGAKQSGAKRSSRSCMKRHGRKSTKKRGGVKWGCMS